MSFNARYDEVADFYQRFNFNPDFTKDSENVALVDLLGPVRERRLLDLACGNGRVARELARRGASVTGVDLSDAMLASARAAELAEPLGITYVHGDCSSPDVLAGRLFDAAVCHFGLSDIDNLDGCLASVARLLHPDGAFVFSILHPCFPGWGHRSASWPPGGGYYQEGFWVATGSRSTLRQKVGANHRTLSTYLNSLVRHGLVVEEVLEPGLPRGWAKELPGVDPVPVFLIVRCRQHRT